MKFFRLFILCSALLSLSTPARADCSNPAGVAGQQMFNTTYKTMQFCDGTLWWNMKGGGGYVNIDECQPGEAVIFNSTTNKIECPFDHTPDAFSFTDQPNVELSTLTESNFVQIINVDDNTDISISGDGSPEYRICDDATCSTAPAYTSPAGTIDNGDYLQLRLTSSADYETAFAATVTIGDDSDQWSVTTRADCTSGSQTWDTPGVYSSVSLPLPTGCGTYTIQVVGAAGYHPSCSVGKGGDVTFDYVPGSGGQTFDILVGNHATTQATASTYGGGAGSGSGGYGSYGGGGASAIKIEANVLAVSGGGGGTSWSCETGVGGNGGGGNNAGAAGMGAWAGLGGANNVGGSPQGNSGSGNGGPGGSGGANGSNGVSASPGPGGTGSAAYLVSGGGGGGASGAGGGGGYGGGAGGTYESPGAGGGGGGGYLNLAPSTGIVSNVNTPAPSNTGNGFVTISWGP